MHVHRGYLHNNNDDLISVTPCGPKFSSEGRGFMLSGLPFITPNPGQQRVKTDVLTFDNLGTQSLVSETLG